MISIDPRDSLTEEEVEELLTDHYGFKSTLDGFVIPELDESRTTAIGAAEARAIRAGAGGRAKAKALSNQPQEVKHFESQKDPCDF
jgi:hypothetical protein